MDFTEAMTNAEIASAIAVEVPLTRSKFIALVDDVDGERVLAHKWHLANGYARSFVDGKNIYMQRLIMGSPPQGHVTDHINRNRLDNRRENLRWVSYAQNSHNHKLSASNTTGYIGVSWHKRKNKFTASIKVNGKTINLGAFDTALEAARCRDAAAIEYHGDFAAISLAAIATLGLND